MGGLGLLFSLDGRVRVHLVQGTVETVGFLTFRRSCWSPIILTAIEFSEPWHAYGVALVSFVWVALSFVLCEVSNIHN